MKKENNRYKKTRIAGIIIKNKKLLLLKGKEYEFLWTPGGKKEDKESDEECMARELKEELNVSLQEMSFFKEYHKKGFFDPSINVTERVYFIKIKGNIKTGAEIKKVVWIKKTDYKNEKYEDKIICTHIISDLIKTKKW
jgi:8-oxo-dGTP pyrophosphatase MutT (NUDIX family)